MQVKKLRQVFVVADDIDRQVDFYANVLGLEQQFRDGDNWVQFKAGDISFAVASAAEGQGAPAGIPVPVFEVDDINAAVAEVLAAGGAGGAIRDMGSHGKTALVTDAGGARISFFQR